MAMGFILTLPVAVWAPTGGGFDGRLTAIAMAEVLVGFHEGVFSLLEQVDAVRYAKRSLRCHA
jgi:hypothetical protein